MKSIYRTAFLIVVAYLGGCSSTSAIVYRHPNFDAAKRYRTVVLPFRDAVGCPGSGETVASMFEAALLASNKFEVLDRKEVERILNEQGVNTVQEFDDPVAIGRRLKADLVVEGDVTTWVQGAFLGQYTTAGASVKAVNVDTGVVFWSLDETTKAEYFGDGIPVDGPVGDVGRKLCREMVTALVRKN